MKHSRYLKVLEQASGTDKQVRDKWDEWKDNIEQLCWDEVRAHPRSIGPAVDVATSRTP